MVRPVIKVLDVNPRTRDHARMSKWKQHIVLDVESDGPCPSLYNMISFGLVCVGDPAQSFLGEVAPVIDNPGIAAAREVSGVSFETQQTYRAAELVMADAKDWLGDIAGAGKRPIFWSDNPAFDWQFWNWHCHKFLGDNPAGFSARRIGDFDAGRRGEPLNTSAWKKRRETSHTHNPVDDARGNAEALRWILQQMGEKFD
jgi:hypothetical protein